MLRTAREKGALTAMMALMLPLVLAAIGLIIDLGRMYTFKREMQSAADAAAIAAMQEWRATNYSGYDKAALDDAALNGFDPDGEADVDLNVPPTMGPYAGDTAYLEVVVRQRSPRYFMRPFVHEDPMVMARAVATLGPVAGCVYVLDPHAPGALTVSGTADVTLRDCGVLVNSDATNAAVENGTATFKATAIGTVGGYNGDGFQPTPRPGIDPFTDPLASLPAPAVGACDFTGTLHITSNVTLSPATYCGGIDIQSGAVVTLLPGTYVLAGGGMKNAGQSVLRGDGITLYNTEKPGYRWQPMLFSGGATVQLTPPTEGIYKGILVFNDRDVNAKKDSWFAGNEDSYFTGVIYYPSGSVKWVGTSTTVAQKTMILAKTVEFTGTTQFDSFDLADNVLPTSLSAARLVE